MLLVSGMFTGPSGDELVEGLRREIRKLDRDLLLVGPAPLTTAVEGSMQRIGALVFGVFGLVAIGLAAVGIYGVMSFTVARRCERNEGPLAGVPMGT